MEIAYTVCGLDYIYLVDPPIGKTEDSEDFIDLPMESIEVPIAREILKQNIPLDALRPQRHARRGLLQLSRFFWSQQHSFSRNCLTKRKA